MLSTRYLRRLLSHVVAIYQDAVTELDLLDTREQVAVSHAIEKLEALGDRLPYPHQSAVRGAPPLRELRPRGGRSRWRALYARHEEGFVILAIVPEALVDDHAFNRGVSLAQRRITSLKE
jgi:hypothetical protein